MERGEDLGDVFTCVLDDDLGTSWMVWEEGCYVVDFSLGVSMVLIGVGYTTASGVPMVIAVLREGGADGASLDSGSSST